MHAASGAVTRAEPATAWAQYGRCLVGGRSSSARTCRSKGSSRSPARATTTLVGSCAAVLVWDDPGHAPGGVPKIDRGHPAVRRHNCPVAGELRPVERLARREWIVRVKRDSRAAGEAGPRRARRGGGAECQRCVKAPVDEVGRELSREALLEVDPV